MVVVRGGLAPSTRVRESAADAFDEYGIYAVSVFLALDEPVEELCRREPFLDRYRRIRRSTVGRVRAAGFALPQPSDARQAGRVVRFSGAEPGPRPAHQLMRAREYA